MSFSVKFCSTFYLRKGWVSLPLGSSILHTLYQDLWIWSRFSPWSVSLKCQFLNSSTMAMNKNISLARLTYPKKKIIVGWSGSRTSRDESIPRSPVPVMKLMMAEFSTQPSPDSGPRTCGRGAGSVMVTTLCSGVSDGLLCRQHLQSSILER